ncbi:MAG: aminoglycoside phosphotransferase family protein [Anaerolineales bacterium]|nr:aminoglycoside phosphotransferase family protein [Anaerolineales bacterium]
MLEKPALDEGRLAACLQADYGLAAVQLTFLPLGADLNTAVYRADSSAAPPRFVKLRRGAFNELAVALPRCLRDQGLDQVMAPLATQAGRLWADLDPYTVSVYPFVDGQDGYAVPLSEAGWIELGRTLRRLHAADLPPALRARLPREAYSPEWRRLVQRLLEHAAQAQAAPPDPVAAEAAAVLRDQREAITELVERAGRLAAVTQARAPAATPCHADLHAGNLLIGADGAVFIVDWDEPLLAPKERDLMYVGGGLMGGWRRPAEETALFYQGYGTAPIDPAALAYYRYERIIQDIAVIGRQLLWSAAGGQDRAVHLGYLKSNFQPGGVLEIARQAEGQQPAE